VVESAVQNKQQEEGPGNFVVSCASRDDFAQKFRKCRIIENSRFSSLRAAPK